MKKKILALCLVVVLAVTAVTGATLAYFTDTEKATNVMTIGNVDITLKEYTYDHDEEKYNPFDGDSLTMYPMEDSQGNDLWNKYVQIKNTSPSEDDVYVRCIVAVEDWYDGDKTVKGVHLSRAEGTTVTEYEDIKIDGKNYDVYVYELAGDTDEAKALAYNEAHGFLTSVWLDKNLTQAQIANYFGEKLEILVLAQGIQTEGLSYAAAMGENGLGLITSENLSSWFDTTNVVGNVTATNP